MNDQPEAWPVFPVELECVPRFLFILTPPCSGSTLLAKILNTAPRTMLLHPKAEGLWLIPGTRTQDSWKAEFPFMWESVRSVWLKRIELVQSLVGKIELVIEKSPVLLVRFHELREVFPNSHFIVLNRDPVASCSSFFHRYNHPQMKPEQRCEELKILAEKWVRRSTLLRDAAESCAIPKVRYEEFCDNPADCVAELARTIPELAAVDTESPVQVKDYPEQRISNQNERQLAWLTGGERTAIRSVLVEHPDLLDYFGYPPK